MMHVRCPHCRNPIDVVGDGPLTEITCPSCGSVIGLLSGDETASYPGAGDPGATQRTIAHFELGDCLGRGAFGTVWKARDTELDRTVAIKIPRAEQASNRDTEYFFREARAAAQLKHPGIVGVHEIGSEGETAYIVSDYVEGANLKEWLSKSQLTPREAADLCRKLANALHHAHEAGVVHRDLKPSNIMMGVDGEPRVMDFGLAKRDANEITMTIEGHILGTPAYMSPEQARGEGHTADRRSDIYSLGVIIFELLTGELPFRGAKQMLIIQILNDDPPSPRKLNSRLPMDLETICLKCLEKSPGGRYSTATELADELQRYLRDEPIIARPVGKPTRLWRWCLRNRALAGAGVISIILLIGISLVSISFALSKSRSATEIAKSAAELQAEQVVTQGLLRDVKIERDKKDTQRRAALRQLAVNLNQTGTNRCLRGEVATGMQHIARSLELAVETRERDLEHAIRVNLNGWWSRLPVQTAWNRRLSQQAHWVHPCPDGTALLIRGSVSHQGHVIRDSPRRVKVHKSGDIGLPLRARGRIASVAFDLHGRYVLLNCENKFLQLFELPTARLIGTTDVPKSGISSVLVHTDGRTVLIAANDGTVIGWNAETRKPPFPPFRIPNGKVIAISPNLRIGVVLLKDNNKTIVHNVQLWDIGKSKAIGPPLPIQLTAGQRPLGFTRDGASIYIGDGQSLRRYSTHDARLTEGFAPPLFAYRVMHVTCSPNGSQLAVGTGDKLVLCDAVFGKQLAVLSRNSARTQRVAFNEDGKGLMVVSDSDVRSFRLNASIYGASTDQTSSAHAFSPDGKRLLIATKAGVVGLAVPSFESTPFVITCKGRVHKVRYSTDGTSVIVTAYDDGMGAWIDRRFDAENRLLLDEDFHRLISKNNSVILSPDGRFAFVKPRDFASSGQMWDLTRRTRIGKPYADWELVKAFTSDAKTCITISMKGGFPTIRVRETRSGNLIGKAIKGHNLPQNSIVSPDDRLFLTLTSNKRIVELRSITTAEPVGASLSHTGSVVCARFNRNGDLILTGTSSGKVRLWDTRTGKPKGPVLTHPSQVLSLDMSSNGRTIAVGCIDMNAYLWNAADGLRLGPPVAHLSYVDKVRFAPDGRYLATSAWYHAYLRKVPMPVKGGPTDVRTRLESDTSQELLVNNSVQSLGMRGWHNRRAKVLGRDADTGATPRRLSPDESREQKLALTDLSHFRPNVMYSDSPSWSERISFDFPVVGIRMYTPDVTDKDVTQLRRLHNLRKVTLSRSKITDKGLAILSELPAIEELILYNTQISNAGLASLKRMRKLTVLSLSNTAVSDTGIAELLNLKTLRILFLNRTHVSDTGIARMKGLTELQELHVANTSVTDQAIGKLKQVLPNCLVVK